MFRKFFINPMVNFWNVATGKFDPYAGFTSKGKAEIYSKLASESFKEGNKAAGDFSKNAGEINIKPVLIAGVGALALGTAGVLAGPVAPGAAAVMKGLASTALAHPVAGAMGVEYLCFPNQVKGLGAIPKNYSEAAIQGAKSGFFKVKGWLDGDTDVISDAAKELFLIDLGHDITMVSTGENLSESIRLIGESGVDSAKICNLDLDFGFSS